MKLAFSESVRHLLARIRRTLGPEGAIRRLKPDHGPAPHIRHATHATASEIARLWDGLLGHGRGTAEARDVLADPATTGNAERYTANIENMIGTVKVPLGIAGPLRINGLHAKGDYFVPLATTEAALVASFARGSEVITRAGGASVALLGECVLRSPGFVFRDLGEAGLFVAWVMDHADALKEAAESTTRHGRLFAIEPVIDTNVVFLLCRYTTGDASGQNMVTIATDALCGRILDDCPVQPQHWFIEANFSGDKKASYLGLLGGRGRKVTASVTIPGELVQRMLHTPVAQMIAYGRIANLGALMSGQLGAQGHYANALAAFYIATGQDAACVSESSVGFTRMEPAGPEGHDLFVSVTLPNILVGSVGGGTGLPSQGAALDIMGLKGAGHADALAEVAAALCLAGEISIIGAIAANQFTNAHARLARGRQAPDA